MDDKKKSLLEETKESLATNDEVVEFDDFRNAQDMTPASNAILEEKKSKEKKDSEKETISKEKKDDSKENDLKDKQELEKEEPSEDKKNSEKEENQEGKQKSEKKEELKDSEKKEEPKDSEKKEEPKDSEKKEDFKSEKEPGKQAIIPEKKKSKKGIAIFFSVLAAVIAIIYVAGFVYFSNYFYPSVAINGTNVSGMNKETAKKTLDDFNKNYILTLETIDNQKVIITGSEIEMNIQLHDEFNNCLKNQKAYMWFLEFTKHHDYTVSANATWNQEKLDDLYKDMQILDKELMVEPKDAYIGIEDGNFAIVKEELGTTINTEQFKTMVNDSLSKVIASVKLQDAGCYTLPKIYSTDEALNAEFNAKSEYLNGVITLQLDDLTLEPGIELYDAVLQKDGDTYTISQTKVESYVKDLAAKYDTMGTERTFTSTYGGGKKVKIGGTAFGYEMDQEATADALYQALLDKKSATVEAVFKTKGYTLQGENDIGDTYIECNLSEQKVVAYKDGKKIAEGDCVSGCESNGNGTCLGLYAIQDKLSPTVLRGPLKEVTKTVTKKNKKGKKVKVKETTMEYEYESPVTYWLQFNGGYGLHDAAGWRSVYGGNIYYYNGSHGCVNLPYDLAETLYENFDLGDPVVVYFYDNEKRE